LDLGIEAKVRDEQDERVVLEKIKNILKSLSKIPIEELKKHIILFVDPHSVEHGEFAGDEV